MGRAEVGLGSMEVGLDWGGWRWGWGGSHLVECLQEKREDLKVIFRTHMKVWES